VQGIKYLLLVTMLVFAQVTFAAAPVFGTAAETKYARDLVPPKGKALIYIYQREQDGEGATPTIWLNNYEIGRIVPGSFTVWQLAPGRLNLRVGRTEPATLSVLSAAGKVYLFRLTVVQTQSGAKAQIESLPDSYRGDMAMTQFIKNPRQVTAVAAQAPVQSASPAASATPATTTQPKPKAKPEAQVAYGPGGAVVMFKIGSLSLSNQTQSIDISGTTFDLNYDKSVSGLFGIEAYYQSGSGLATGGELLSYKAHFTTSGGTSSGDVSVLVALANVKQYFLTDSSLQPYVGAGFGAALAKVSGTAITGNTAGFAYQLVGGVEYRTSSVGFFAEAKYLSANTKDKNSQSIDMTGTGFFAGVAVHF